MPAAGTTATGCFCPSMIECECGVRPIFVKHLRKGVSHNCLDAAALLIAGGFGLE
ncbi:MAG TPA: hypothetical protein VKY65_09760 [Alphaproteobacteria bacterium]|nr:hypothetical protein [Alphaproteobacteria bacterium]